MTCEPFGRQGTNRCWQEAGASQVENGSDLKLFHVLGGLISEEYDNLLNVLHLPFNTALICIF